MDDEKMKNDYPDNMQRYAVCQSIYTNEKMAVDKISFDFDGTLNTTKGKELAKSFKDAQLYIISARDNKTEMYKIADEVGIPTFRIYAMGSNELKVFKIKDLGIKTHYDNNIEVIKQLPGVGKLFSI
jgi:soluble P-type ATPase